MRPIVPFALLAFALPAGAHWSPVARPSDRGLASVCVLSPAAAWVAGEAGTAFFTEDGGQTWIPQATSLSNTLVSLSFSDPLNGWVCGEGGDAARTQDGGGHWDRQIVAVDDYGLGPPDAIAPIRATGPASAWTLGRWADVSAVYHTTNGGSTWTPVPYSNHSYHAPNTVYTLTATSDSQAWLLASRIDAENLYAPTLLRTTNGGTTWEIVPLPGTQMNQPTNPQWETAISAVSPTEVWTYVRETRRNVSTLYYTIRDPITGTWYHLAWDINETVRSIDAFSRTEGFFVGARTQQSAHSVTLRRRTPNPDGRILTADFASAALGMAVAPDGTAWRWTADAPGDVNGDGTLDLPDAAAALSIAQGGPPSDALSRSIADIAPPGGDGQVTAEDAVAILRAAGGIP